MNSVIKFSEIIYWIIVVICVYEGYNNWESNPSRAYIFIGFGILSMFMALFRRHWRKRFEKRTHKD